MIVRLSYDIDMNIPVYPGNPKNRITEYHNIRRDGVETHEMMLFTHNGTHIDLPKHYLDTDKDITKYNISDFIFNNVQLVNYCETLPLRKGRDLLIIRTNMERSALDYPLIDRTMAEEICRYDYRCVAVNTLSIGSPSHPEAGEEVHKILFRKGITIVEDINLSPVINHDIKRVFVMPLFVKGLEASPCTIFAEVKNV